MAPEWIGLRPPCGASQETHDGLVFDNLPCGRLGPFASRLAGARQAIVQTSPLQYSARPRVAHFGARSGLPTRSFSDRSRGAVCPSP